MNEHRADPNWANYEHCLCGGVWPCPDRVGAAIEPAQPPTACDGIEVGLGCDCGQSHLHAQPPTETRDARAEDLLDELGLEKYPRWVSAIVRVLDAERQASIAERDAVIRELRQKLALAGVEGSPPVGETTIGALSRRAHEAETRVAALTEERDELRAALLTLLHEEQLVFLERGCYCDPEGGAIHHPACAHHKALEKGMAALAAPPAPAMQRVEGHRLECNYHYTPIGGPGCICVPPAASPEGGK